MFISIFITNKLELNCAGATVELQTELKTTIIDSNEKLNWTENNDKSEAVSARFLRWVRFQYINLNSIIVRDYSIGWNQTVKRVKIDHLEMSKIIWAFAEK